MMTTTARPEQGRRLHDNVNGDNDVEGNEEDVEDNGDDENNEDKEENGEQEDDDNEEERKRKTVVQGKESATPLPVAWLCACAATAHPSQSRPWLTVSAQTPAACKRQLGKRLPVIK